MPVFYEALARQESEYQLYAFLLWDLDNKLHVKYTSSNSHYANERVKRMNR